jgi:hypothetical protein
VRSALFQLDGIEVLVSLITSGACERYVDFRFVLGESGVTWIPYVLDGLDTGYEDEPARQSWSASPRSTRTDRASSLRKTTSYFLPAAFSAWKKAVSRGSSLVK